MKFKTTKKAVKEGFYNVISVGYCDMQGLLNYKSPAAYTCGVYGWNSDIYVINNNTCIVTGYRPFGNISPDYETIKKYETAAGEILRSDNVYADKETALNNLIYEFIDNVTSK